MKNKPKAPEPKEEIKRFNLDELLTTMGNSVLVGRYPTNEEDINRLKQILSMFPDNYLIVEQSRDTHLIKYPVECEFLASEIHSESYSKIGTDGNVAFPGQGKIILYDSKPPKITFAPIRLLKKEYDICSVLDKCLRTRKTTSVGGFDRGTGFSDSGTKDTILGIERQEFMGQDIDQDMDQDMDQG